MISWIKLDVNILDDAKIKIIRSHPDGSSIVLLWIGLLCLAMKSARPGIIEISNGLPYTVDDLASAFSIEKKTVELGLMLFKKYQMIDIFDGDTIEVINFAKHQSIEELERKRELTRARVSRYREKLKCNALLTQDSRDVTLTDKIRQDKIREESIGTPTDKKSKIKTSIPENFQISDRVRKWAAGKNQNHLEEHLESFKLKCKSKDYKYIDWDAAFMNAIRDNWAKVDNGGGTSESPPSMVISCQKCGARILRSDLVGKGCVNCEYGKPANV
jgi:predicted phage replisome organizer